MKKKHTQQIAGFSLLVILLVVNFGLTCLGKPKFGASKAVTFDNLGKNSALASQRCEGVPTITTKVDDTYVVILESSIVKFAVAEGLAAPKSAISSDVSLSNLD